MLSNDEESFVRQMRARENNSFLGCLMFLFAIGWLWFLIYCFGQWKLSVDSRLDALESAKPAEKSP